MSTTLALIVCTYRRPDEVARLLDGLALQDRVPDDILVVDGSPDDATRDVVAACDAPTLAGRLRYVAVPEAERGLTRQRNYGIARTDAEIIAFLDDDTVPEPAYFTAVLACFDRHPEAIGVAGFQTGVGVTWTRAAQDEGRPLNVFRYRGWQRREDFRWRLRRMLGLAGDAPPGWMPAMGHGRPLGYLPPDGEDHPVESIIGCAAAWRRSVFDHISYSPYFVGYGLYEDLDFAIRAARLGPLVMATRARVRHDHAPSGRPNQWRSGVMVSRNGWLVWRRRWPSPPVVDRLRWWATSLLLAVVRGTSALRGQPWPAVSEAAGRIGGLMSILVSPPRDPHGR